MKWPIQRPATWLYNALGIVAGTNPTHLESINVPIVDVMQQGWGVAREVLTAFNGHLPGNLAVTQEITLVAPGDATKCHVIAVSGRNPGSAQQTTRLVLIRPPNNLVSALQNLDVWTQNMNAGQRFGFLQWNSGAPWVFVPPGWGVGLMIGPFTTTAGEINFSLWEFPAGLKPW